MRGLRTALALVVSALGMVVFPGAASAQDMVLKPGQVEKALAGGATYDYATIFVGTNDTCTDQTPPPTFRAQVDSALAKLAPSTGRIFVASIPDLTKLFDLYVNSAERDQALAGWDTVNCRRFLTTDEEKKVGALDHLKALNAQLALACAAKAPKCVFDNNALFDWQPQDGDFASDYFHYSVAGQQALAAVTFPKAFPEPPAPAPKSMVALGDSFTAGLKSCDVPGTSGCQQNSWATGTDVNSHAQRLGILVENRRNVSNGGDRAIDLTDHYVPRPAPQPQPQPEPADGPAAGGAPTPAGAAPTPAAGVAPAAAAPVVRRRPAKLKVKRASIRGGRLDVLLGITGRATGQLEIRYHAAGKRTSFSVKVGPAQGGEKRVRIQQRLAGDQRRVRTGIMTAIYRGNAAVFPESLRSRAANGRSRLRTGELSFAESRLRLRGTVDPDVGGVVRLRVIYTAADGTAAYWRGQERIEKGRWAVDEDLPQAVAADPDAYLTTQFTGDTDARGGPYRGEQDGKGLANLPAG